jgi:hypothetical protein
MFRKKHTFGKKDHRAYDITMFDMLGRCLVEWWKNSIGEDVPRQ